MESVFLNRWSNLAGVFSDFEMEAEEFDWIFASYSYEPYEGEAYVLFQRNGKVFVVQAGHCSCHGLEGQWNPQETSIEAIRYMLEKGSVGKDSYSGNIFSDELKEFISKIA